MVISAVGVRENFKFDWMPFRELVEVVDDSPGVGADVVWSADVKEDASVIIFVSGISAEVIPLFDNKALSPKCRGEALGNGQARRAGAVN